MNEFDYAPSLPDAETRGDLYKALRGMLAGEEFVNPYRFGSTSFDQNPQKFIDKSDPSYEESIFAEPSELPQLDTGGIAGQIRGLPNKLAKIVRKAMQNELKARGPAPFAPSTSTHLERAWKESGVFPALPTSEAQVTAQKALEEADVTSRLLRGPWYRGQDKYPSEARLEKVLDPSTGKEVEEYVTKQWGKEYGTEAPVFAGLRAKQSNLGEPHGISLSYDPNVSTGFGAPQTLSQTKLDKVYRTKILAERDTAEAVELAAKYKTPGYADDLGIAIKEETKASRLYDLANRLRDTQKVSRVMPLYGEAPEGKILQAWKPKHGAEFRDAYVSSAREMAEKYPEFRKSIETLNPGASGEEIKNAIQKATNKFNVSWEGSKATKIHLDQPTTVAHDTKYQSSRDELNSLMSKKLMERGYKGMLHSPHRYQEYELRMFDPYDVMYLDKRAVNSSKYSNNPMSSKAVRRLDEMKSALKREHETVTEGESKTLADWYRDITREEILGLPKASNAEINNAIASKPWNADDPITLLDDSLDAITGHGDMADKVAPTAAMLEWGKKNKAAQEEMNAFFELHLNDKWNK